MPGAVRELPPLTIEELDFMYRPNFEGREERYNEKGNRYFNAKIPPEAAEGLLRDGWNIKWTKPGANHPNPEEHVPEPYLEVTVGFKYRPPEIVLIRDNRPTRLKESNVFLVDSTEFSNIDVAIRAVHWEGPQGSGYKAYLKSFYGTVEMDDIQRKYAHLSVSDDEIETSDPTEDNIS